MVSKINKYFARVLCVLACALSMTGCFLKTKPAEPVLYSKQIGGSAQQTQDLTITHKKLTKALAQTGDANNVRLVQVFRREEQLLPQYRLFGIQRGSVYDLLGLQETDILLAADDHVIFNSAAFRTYVLEFLPKEKDASITILRDGVTILYRYHFVD